MNYWQLHGLAKRSRRNAGQALAEFTIMLLVFMILINGMVYTARLLVFDYWAQQEARIIAFEQMDAPASTYSDPSIDPIEDLDNGNGIVRPGLVSNLNSDKDAEDDGDLEDLLSFRESFYSPTPPVMFARRQLPNISQQQAELFAALRPETKEDWGVVATAVASQVRKFSEESGGSIIPDLHLPPHQEIAFTPLTRTEVALVKILRSTQFGEKFCDTMATTFAARGYQQAAKRFTNETCPAKYELGFGVHLSRSSNYKEVFRDFGYLLEGGVAPGEALQTTLEHRVVSGFYSFFDSTIRDRANQAQSTINDWQDEHKDTIDDDDQFDDLLWSLRYLGSIVAVQSLDQAITSIKNRNDNRNFTAEKAFEDDLNEFLHSDATDIDVLGDIGLGDVGFYLGPEYLPFITPVLEPMMGSLFGGLMQNVLSKENSLHDPLIHESNKKVTVTYRAGNGLFPRAVQTFNTNGKALSSRFYLLTKTWHIPRRVDPFGPYRELGHEDDESLADTEEGMLKARVVGLWLFPSDIPALLEPIFDLVPGGDAVADLFEGNFVMEGLGDAINLLSEFAKDAICSNPINEAFQWIDELTSGSLDVSFPSCPAVRPAAYPFTTEIENDQTAGESRNFSDFVREQIESNPRARPSYHDDDDEAKNGGGQSDQGSKVCGWED